MLIWARLSTWKTPMASAVAQHVVDVGSFLAARWPACSFGFAPLRMGVDQVEGLADAGQHAQRQHIHLHDRQGVQIVLVPFDEIAVVHRGGADGHGPVQLVAVSTKPPTCWDRWRGKAHQPLAKVHGALDGADCAGSQLALAHLMLFQLVAMMAPDRVGQLAGDVFGQAEHLAHFADGAARAVMDDGGGQGGAAAAIAAIDILDDFLAPLMLEIHVDVGRLARVRC